MTPDSIETLAFVYLFLSVAATAAVGSRLPQCYGLAVDSVRNRLLMMRLWQGHRRALNAITSDSGYEKTLQKMRLF